MVDQYYLHPQHKTDANIMVVRWHPDTVTLPHVDLLEVFNLPINTQLQCQRRAY